MIYYIPIEPLDERYTEQWYRWFPQEFKRQNKEFTVIDGTPLLEGEIDIIRQLNYRRLLNYSI